MKKVTKAQQAKRKKVTQKRADYTKARGVKLAAKKGITHKAQLNKTP